jgi:hypothetical protein
LLHKVFTLRLPTACRVIINNQVKFQPLIITSESHKWGAIETDHKEAHTRQNSWHLLLTDAEASFFFFLFWERGRGFTNEKMNQ